jgi:hypothetical protein
VLIIFFFDIFGVDDETRQKLALGTINGGIEEVIFLDLGVAVEEGL